MTGDTLDKFSGGDILLLVQEFAAPNSRQFYYNGRSLTLITTDPSKDPLHGGDYSDTLKGEKFIRMASAVTNGKLIDTSMHVNAVSVAMRDGDLMQKEGLRILDLLNSEDNENRKLGKQVLTEKLKDYVTR
jgi:hypothetical protein